MAAIAHPLNIVFYGVSHKALATAVLAFSSFVSIMLGLFSVTSAIMQGVSQNKRAVRYFAVGTIVKLALQWPCVHYMGVFGPLVATMIGFVVANVLIVSWLNQAFGVDYQGIAKKTNGILGFSLIMCLLANMIVRLVSSGLGHIMTVDSRVGSLIIVILAVGIAGYVYVYFVLKTRLADTVLGERTARLRRLLRIK
ncbi:polysaccharide biosynthesis C-terminal domain-containing protein [Secundilactobacillus similis]